MLHSLYLESTHFVDRLRFEHELYKLTTLNKAIEWKNVNRTKVHNCINSLRTTEPRTMALDMLLAN